MQNSPGGKYSDKQLLVLILVLLLFILNVFLLLGFWGWGNYTGVFRENVNFLIPFSLAILFSLIGIISLGFVLKHQRQRIALQQKYPNQPWLWRQNWATGKINSIESKNLLYTWVAVIVWNAFSWVVFINIILRMEEKSNLVFVLVGLFPLFGIFMLISAIRETIRWKKFGQSIFEMRSVPGVIGGKLEGNIYSGLKETPSGGVMLTLSCINRITTGAGKNRSVREKVLWEEKQNVNSGYLTQYMGGKIIPVSFNIPTHCISTNNENPQNLIIWRLRADASVPGIDYKAVFEVPVFKV